MDSLLPTAALHRFKAYHWQTQYYPVSCNHAHLIRVFSRSLSLAESLSCPIFHTFKLESSSTNLVPANLYKDFEASIFPTGPMEPITVVSLVAAIVQLIEATSKVISYFNTMKNAPKDRAKLVREAYSLLTLLADLRDQVEENNSSTNSWFTGLQSLGEEGGPLMQFKNAMEDIANMLAPTTDFARVRRVVRWKSDKKEIDAILSKIERLKSLIGLALQKDHM